MNIVLIIPPSPFLIDEKRNCPLGILYVAASLENAGYEVQVTDLRGNTDWGSIPLCSTYGITCTSAEFPVVRSIANFLRERGSCKIIIGGPHTQDLESLKDFSIVIGEGETAVLDLLNNGSRILRGSFIDNLDNIPYPARHLLPRYTVVSNTLCHQGVPATTIIASRGCPYNCIFCSSPRLWGRKVRRHSPSYVILEVAHLVKEYGIQELRFQDDNLNLSKKWLQEIVPISDLVKFRCNARAEVGNWEYLKEAGCYECSIGVESANPAVHKASKGVSLKETKQGIWDAYNTGLQVRVCFIIGLPNDTGDISLDTIQFLEELPPVSGVFLSLLSPNPGSAIWNNPRAFGVEIIKNMIPSVPEPGGVPNFSYKLKGIDMKNLEYHYERLNGYVTERNLKP